MCDDIGATYFLGFDKPAVPGCFRNIYVAIPENIYVTILYSRDLELGGKKYELMVFTSQVGQWHSLFRFLRSNLSQILLFGRFYQLAGQLRGISVSFTDVFANSKLISQRLAYFPGFKGLHCDSFQESK